jgi:hypothetical protein
VSAITSEITLWLFVINLGVAFGAGLYEPELSYRGGSLRRRPAAGMWNLNYLRHLIVLTAWLASLKAFALFYQQRG